MSTIKQNRDLYITTAQRLGDLLIATVRYIPVLTLLLALGLLGIYALASYKILGTPAQQLLVAAGVSLAVGLVHLPAGRIRALVNRHAYGALCIFGALLGAWSISIVLLWEAAAPIAIIMAWVAFLVALAAGVRGRWLLGLGAASLALTAGLLWLNARPFSDRLTTSNPAGLAAIVLLASTVLLFILGTIVVRLFRYRSVQGRLVTAMTLIMAVPVLFTTGIAAITSYSNSQGQFRESLHAVTTLRRVQIDSIVQPIASEMSNLQAGSGRARAILQSLYPGTQDMANYQLNVQAATALLSTHVQQYPATAYEEILALNLSGGVGLSTGAEDVGKDFSNEDFFEQGKKGFYAELMRFPGQTNPNGAYKLVVAAPLRGSMQDVRGVVVAVIKSDRVLAQVGPVADLEDTSTYLVSRNQQLITRAAGSSVPVSALPIAQLIVSRGGQGSDTYRNYSGRSSLGYFEWDPVIHAVIVSEIPSSNVYTQALSSLLISGLVGLLAIVIAAIAALSTAQAISEPIRALAATAKTLSTGDLEARADVDQHDEVGNLADSFNTMAAQLQGIVGNLEQRVAERTEALAQQSNRLRAAAEVARDAASAADLDELLDRAGRLIMDRFGFYHAGIFLVDEKGEYAVLRASPSEAGRKMLENQHKLRVGEQGIVGRVAATGEPRIALDTGVDPVYFSNPLLPHTHSEMALPLKSSEGTIGVIDIQSDQPEAFTQDDIAIVQVMADQLATAIQRVNLLQQVQAQLQQLEKSYASFTEQSWHTFGRVGRQTLGYKFDNVRLESIKAVPEDLRPALEPGSKGLEDRSGQSLQVPIRLRGQVIGVVHLRFQGTHRPAATDAMIQQIADRLATALENARLLEDSLRRANKERAIGEITAKISASMNMRNVLQTAVEELGRAIPGSEVMIQFRPDAEI